VFTPCPKNKKAQSAKTARILNKDASETADARFGKNNAGVKLHGGPERRNKKYGASNRCR
jgi:hypothetical protein